MVFTISTDSNIKTNEYSKDLRKFFSGDLEAKNHCSFDKKTEKKKQRQNIVQIILERYPLVYNKETNFSRYSTYELNSILEFGDPRANVDPELLNIDYNPYFYEDPKGKIIISHNEIDLSFKDIHQEDIARQLRGYGMVHSLKVTKPKLKESKHLARMRDYKRILKSLPIKYRRASLFLLKEKLEEVAISSMDYYSKKAKMYLAAVVILLMRSYQEGIVTSIGIKEVCQDFNIESNGITKYFQSAISKLDFIKTRSDLGSSSVNNFTLKKKQIKTTAKNFIYQFAQEDLVANPSIINEFIEEFDNHYNNIFQLKNKKEKVLAILAAKLFDPHIKVSELALSLYNGGFTVEDLKNVDLLTKQVKSWMRINDREIANDVMSGRIRNLYVTDIEPIDQFMPEPQVLELEDRLIVTTDNTTSLENSKSNGQIRQSSFEVNYEPFSDKIILVNDQNLLNYLSDNELLDQINLSIDLSTTIPKLSNQSARQSSKKRFRNTLKMNSVAVNVNEQYYPDQVNSLLSQFGHRSLDLHDSYEGYLNNYQNDSIIDKKSLNQRDENSNVPINRSAINRIYHDGDERGGINYCYLGYPGATTRLLALLSLRSTTNMRENQFLNSDFYITDTDLSEEGQNPSIIWLLNKQEFYNRADQVMMNRDGLFGKWRQYADRENIKFLDELDIKIDTVDQLLDNLERVNATGCIRDGSPPLHRDSVIIFPDLQKILLAEVESSVLRMSPNDFVRMKNDHTNMKLDDLQRAKNGKIRIYSKSLRKEANQGIYKGMQAGELQALILDFTSAQEEQFDLTRQKLRMVLKMDIDEFIDCKFNLSNEIIGSKEYQEIHMSMYRYGLVMSENSDIFFDRLDDLIENIHEKYGIVIYMGGILSKNLKTSQLLLDNTLSQTGLSKNTAEELVDHHLIKLCNSRSNKSALQSASVVSTTIPNKLSISSFKLPSGERELHGFEVKWCADNTYNIETLVDWVR